VSNPVQIFWVSVIWVYLVFKVYGYCLEPKKIHWVFQWVSTLVIYELNIS
jgi:hypothetical protein